MTTTTNCGCVNCKPSKVDDCKGRSVPERGENHMVIYKRLSSIVIMHGTPGQPKGRKSN